MTQKECDAYIWFTLGALCVFILVIGVNVL